MNSAADLPFRGTRCRFLAQLHSKLGSLGHMTRSRHPSAPKLGGSCFSRRHILPHLVPAPLSPHVPGLPGTVSHSRPSPAHWLPVRHVELSEHDCVDVPTA